MTIRTEVYSTWPKTVAVPHQAKWVTLLEDQSLLPGKLYAFTDGSSNGGYGAVLVEGGGGDVTTHSGWDQPTSTRNVGAELNAMLLALRHAPEDSDLIVVSDYLGIAAWMTKNWKIKDPEVREKINQAGQMITEKNLDVLFCHHKGHQRNNTDFTLWNSKADDLASRRS
jgi:ribonuclease HI